MADSLIRLRISSEEYDQKLKRATDGLTRYADECRKVGGTLSVVEQETLDYVKALGQMDTVSRTATGSLAEMKKTYTELSVQYKNLTDEEKASPFGKALAESLNQLKGRIQDAKGNLDDVNKSMTGGGGLGSALDSIAGKFGLNIKQLTGWGAALAAGKVALDVAKDAFFQSETNIDEWGRTLKGAEGAYQVFLDTLNNGNWSKFFDNLETAIKGGRDLYDVFDRLGSIKSNNAAAIAIVQQQIAQLRLAKQQGKDVDDQLKAATARLAALQKQSIQAGKAAGNQTAFNVIRNGVNSIGGARINDATIRLAVDQLMTGGQAQFDKFRNNYQILQRKGTRTVVQQLDDGMGGTVNKYRETFDINALTKEEQKQYAIAKAITEGETRIQVGISAFAQAVSEGTASAREEFRGNRYSLQGSHGGGGGGGKTNPISKLPFDVNSAALAGSQITDRMPSVWSMLGGKGSNQAMGSIIPDITADIERQILIVDELRERWKGADGDIRDGYVKQIIEAEDKLRKLKEEQSISTGDGQKPTDPNKDISTQWKVNKKGQLVQKDEKKKEDTKEVNLLKEVGSITSGVSGIFSGIEQLGIELPKDLKDVLGGIQGVITILSGIATIVTAIQAISAADAIIPFARGGIVPRAAGGYMVGGNQFSGDNVFAGHAWVNSGELILNRSQQNTLAGILDNKQGGGGNGYARVSGEQIYLAINNYLSRSGKGELVTWR